MFNLRNMHENELSMVKQWAIEEGWNPGSQDLEFCFEAYPEAFYILESNSKPVGCTTIMRYSENFAFLGLLVVVPSERGKGCGKVIWEETMKILRDCETIRFYGVLPRKDFYRPFSFFPIDYNSEYIMRGERISEKLSRCSAMTARRSGFFRQPRLDDVAAMATYEEDFLKIRRERLIASFIRKNSENALISIGDDERITGYCAIRPCVKENTYTIKPLYADTYDIAKQMFLELLRHIRLLSPDTFVTIDIPLSNPHISRLVVEFELDSYINPYKGSDTAVMSRPHIDQILESSKIFSRFSLEFS